MPAGVDVIESFCPIDKQVYVMCLEGGGTPFTATSLANQRAMEGGREVGRESERDTLDFCMMAGCIISFSLRQRRAEASLTPSNVQSISSIDIDA